ncbi:alpha/beta hydrolase [Altererythrobacter aquiaggeris]|uniref:alpha/beta hydrolase n=1 Tax=Aestuarierythrobacter aquiaggeris TaxID=1898396 RepID=UPI003018B089
MNIRPFFLVILAICLAACGDSAPNYAANDPVPQHVATSLQSKVLGEARDIAIWLPPEYAANDQDYPVVYMPDGGVKEDFPHIANTLAGMIAAGEIAPVILVGVSNTERGRDMTPASTTDYDRDFGPQTDGAKNFRAFWRDELIPMIERQYRTNSERAIVGESFAGLFIMDSFFREPEVFQRHIAIDPSLWWDDFALVKMSERNLGATDTNGITLWFAGSDAEDINIHTTALARVLRISAPDSLRWKYVSMPEEQHSTIYRAAKEDAFRWALWPARTQSAANR